MLVANVVLWHARRPFCPPSPRSTANSQFAKIAAASESAMGASKLPQRAMYGHERVRSMLSHRQQGPVASAGWPQTAPCGTPGGRFGAPASCAISANWGFSGREGRGGRKNGPARATGRCLWPTCGRPLGEARRRGRANLGLTNRAPPPCDRKRPPPPRGRERAPPAPRVGGRGVV